MPARLTKVISSETALWTGLRARITPSADTTAMKPRMSKTITSAVMLEQPQSPEADQPGQGDVDQRQRQEHLPGQPHQLIVAEARQGRSQPDVEDEEDKRLDDQPPEARGDWTVRSAEEEGRGHQRDDDHVDVLGQEIEREAEAGVLGMEAGNQLGLGLRQVERHPVRLGHRRDQENDEGQRLAEDVPVRKLERA